MRHAFRSYLRRRPAYIHLDTALGLLKAGSIYLVDDMLPQPNWPSDHQLKVDGLLAKVAAVAGVSSHAAGLVNRNRFGGESSQKRSPGYEGPRGYGFNRLPCFTANRKRDTCAKSASG